MLLVILWLVILLAGRQRIAGEQTGETSTPASTAPPPSMPLTPPPSPPSSDGGPQSKIEANSETPAASVPGDGPKELAVTEMKEPDVKQEPAAELKQATAVPEVEKVENAVPSTRPTAVALNPAPSSKSTKPPTKSEERKEFCSRKLRSMRKRYSNRRRDLHKTHVDDAAQRLRDLIQVQMILLTHAGNAMNTEWNNILEVGDYVRFPLFRDKIRELLAVRPPRPKGKPPSSLQRQMDAIDEFVEFIDDMRVEFCNDPMLAVAPYEDQLVDKAKRNQGTLNRWLFRLRAIIRQSENVRRTSGRRISKLRRSSVRAPHRIAAQAP